MRVRKWRGLRFIDELISTLALYAFKGNIYVMDTLVCCLHLAARTLTYVNFSKAAVTNNIPNPKALPVHFLDVQLFRKSANQNVSITKRG